MKKTLSASMLMFTLLAAGCAQSTSAGTSSEATPAIGVVASTNVYGDIAGVIGGAGVSVTSIIDDPDKDPHEYEADAQNQLAISKAIVVIENGGGYDDFIDTMITAAETSAKVVNVADLSGYDQEPAEGAFNEHMWYDFPTMAKLADTLAAEFGAADASQADTFKANATTFKEKLTTLEASEATIKADHAGEGVAITEPVPGYLLDAAGLTNKTPDAFSESIEEGTDAPVAVLKVTVALFDDKQVKLLAYNEQTSGPQTEVVLAAAKKNSIPVVPVRETLPDGQDYIAWMTSNVEALSTALAS